MRLHAESRLRHRSRDERKRRNIERVREVRDRMHFSGATSVLIAHGEESTANRGHQAVVAVKTFYKGTRSEIVAGDWVAMNTGGYVYSAKNATKPKPLG